MLLLINSAPQPHPAEAPEPVRLANPPAPGDREPLRHLIVGSAAGVRSTIHQLHALGYAEHLAWSQLLTIPTSGILLTPTQGEVMSYLIRHRQLK